MLYILFAEKWVRKNTVPLEKALKADCENGTMIDEWKILHYRLHKAQKVFPLN